MIITKTYVTTNNIDVSYSIKTFSRKHQVIDSNRAIKLLNSYRQHLAPRPKEFQSPIVVTSFKPRVTSFKDSDQDSTKTSKNSLPIINILSTSQQTHVKTYANTVRGRVNLSNVSHVSPQTRITGNSPKVNNSATTLKTVQPTPVYNHLTNKNYKRKIGVSAKSFLVFDCKNNKALTQRKANRKYEIASLTKIMTLYVTLKMLEKHNIDPTKLFIKVTKQSSEVIGTSAELKHNDILSVYDLFYGLMLPSGNDAALLLAQGIGTLIILLERNNTIKNQQLIDIETFSAEGMYYNYDLNSHEDPVDYFIKEMNNQAKQIGLLNTQYASVHGLPNRDNYSTCNDIINLSQECFKYNQFEQIVQCKEYRALTVNRTYQWKNTNKLLDKGFVGIKTGVTDNAGPCLASCFKDEQEHFLIVVLNCKNLNSRFDETIFLLQHARRKLCEN